MANFADDKISIIVPVFNSEKYIEKCLQSLLKQTFKNIEIILIDDGSSDASPAICDKYSELDERIIVIHKENGGVSSARNAGLNIATGKYIAFVDSDDWVEENMYSLLYHKIIETKTKCAVCGATFFYNTGRIRTSNLSQFQTNIMSHDEYCKGLCVLSWKEKNQFCNFYLWDKLYSADLWENIRFDENLRNAEDRYALYQISNRIDRVALVKLPLYNYLAANGLSNNPNTDCDYIVGCRMFEQSLKENDANIRAYAGSVLVHICGNIRRSAKSNNKAQYLSTCKIFSSYYKYQVFRDVIKASLPVYRCVAAGLRYSKNMFWLALRVLACKL